MLQKGSYMNWEDACQILGVPATASATDIKAQYIYKAQLLHPDKTIGLPETVRHKAEEELKQVNSAYTLLTDLKVNPQNNPPRLDVSPTHIRFKDIVPGQKKTTIIKIDSVGGAYTKFWMDDSPAAWLKVIEVKSTTNDPLPLEVTIEATGSNKQAVCSLPIRLENEKTKTKDEITLTIELQTGTPIGGSHINSQGNKSQPANTGQKWQKSVIIGICGRSCSGKGVATETLASNNPNVLLLQSDYYFHEKTPCSYGGYSCWEHINCIDFDRLIRDIDSLMRGKGITVRTPSWKSREKVQITPKDLSTKKLIIVEGYLIFAVKQLVDLFDYKIFVDVSDYTMSMRRLGRDGAQTGNYIRDVIVPVSKEYEHIQKGNADVIIDGEKAKTAVIDEVCQFLQQKLSNTGFTLGRSPWIVRPGHLVQDSMWHPIDFWDLKEWVRMNRNKLDSGSVLTGNTFRYRKNLQAGAYEVRMSTQCKPRIRRYTREPT